MRSDLSLGGILIVGDSEADVVPRSSVNEALEPRLRIIKHDIIKQRIHKRQMERCLQNFVNIKDKYDIRYSYIDQEDGIINNMYI